LHEIFFDAAIESAKKLDEYFLEHKKPVGPLHGLPVSLKDQFHVKDVETSMVRVPYKFECSHTTYLYRGMLAGLEHLKAKQVPGKKKYSRVRWFVNCEI
jgi:hypothetical protein